MRNLPGPGILWIRNHWTAREFLTWILFIGFWMLHYPCVPCSNPSWSWCIYIYIYFFFFTVFDSIYWYFIACRSFSWGMWTLRCSMWYLVPRPGMESGPLAFRVRSLSQWTTKDVPLLSFFPPFSFIFDIINLPTASFSHWLESFLYYWPF